MPVLYLKRVPVKLYRRLKNSAEENLRSLNNEAIFRLEQAMGLRPLPGPKEPDRGGMGIGTRRTPAKRSQAGRGVSSSLKIARRRPARR